MTIDRRRVHQAPALQGLTRRQSLALGASLVLVAAPAVRASTPWPTQPIRVVVPFPAGTGLDVDARFFTSRLGDILGQSIVVENKPGAAGTIGMDYAARQSADGYTFLMSSTSGLAYLHLLYTKLNFKPADFTAVSELALLHGGLFANPRLPVRNAAELVALSKARPGTIRAATYGVGTLTHLAGEWFVASTGANIEFVPYNTTSPLTSVMAGDTQVMFDAFSANLPTVEAGRVRAIAVTGSARHPKLPEVPTYAEAGLQNFTPFTWFGLVARAGTPQAVVDKVAAACARVARMPEAVERYKAYCGETVGSTPAEFTAFIQSEQAKWAPVVRRTGIKLD